MFLLVNYFVEKKHLVIHGSTYRCDIIHECIRYVYININIYIYIYCYVELYE